jgi:hypothetical protein
MVIDAAQRFKSLDAEAQKKVISEVEQYQALVGPNMDLHR